MGFRVYSEPKNAWSTRHWSNAIFSIIWMRLFSITLFGSMLMSIYMFIELYAPLALLRFAIFYARTIHLPIYNQYQMGHHFYRYVYTLKLRAHSICLYPRLFFEIGSSFIWIIMIVLVPGSFIPIYSYTFANF